MTMLTRSGISQGTKGRQHGGTMVEAAMIGVVLLVTVFGIMEFGRMVWSYTVICHGAREATRYAMVRGNNSGNLATEAKIKAVVTGQTIGLKKTNVTTTVTFNPNQNAGSYVKVKVAYNISPLGPYLPIGPLTLQSTSEMRIIQ